MFIIKIMSETCEQKEAGENVPIILLEIKQVNAQVMLEKNGQDVALDLGVQTIQIRESTEQHEQNAKTDAYMKEEQKAMNDPRSLFQKVLSNPQEELESRSQPEQAKDLKRGRQQLKVQLF